MATALLAHVRQDCARHRHRAEHIHFKLMADLLIGHVLEKAEQAIARIVDQHVNPPEGGQRPGHRAFDLVLLRHIQRDRFQRTARPGKGGFHFGQPAPACHYIVPCRQRGTRHRRAQPAIGAGDEPCPGCTASHLESLPKCFSDNGWHQRAVQASREMSLIPGIRLAIPRETGMCAASQPVVGN